MTARIYYYPDPNGTLYTIDLDVAGGPYIADAQANQATSMASRDRADGRTYRALLGGQVLLDMQFSVCVDNDQQQELQAWENHIKRGGFFGLTFDTTLAWGAILQGPTFQGAVQSIVTDQRWYEPTVSLPTGTNLVFEQPAPYFFNDYVSSAVSTITQSSAGIINHDAVRFEFYPVGNAGVHVRYEHFWPTLRLRGGSYGTQIVKWFRRQYFDITLPLVYDVASAVIIASAGGVLQSGAAAEGSDGSISQILKDADEPILGTRRPLGQD